MKKTKLLNIVMVIVISASFLAGCRNSTSNQTISSNTKTVGTAASESATETNSASKQTDGVVKTTAGLVQGTVHDGIYTYLGVPYAEATERFVPAGEVKPWDGVRKADAFGPMSPQGSILGMRVNNNETGTSNDCQNLNIWTAGTGDAKKRPVMVWLHGGGFSTGTANNAMNDGKNLSKSGNVGLTDIVAALKWIQDNIEDFGGDPSNVTVFGQSGGGAKVLSLMTSPYAKGLFQKGIVESGATEAMGVTFSTKEESKTLTEHVLKNLGITPDNIEKLQNVSSSDLQTASTKALQDTANTYKVPAAFTDDYAMEWGPVIDGDYMPTNPVTKDGFADAGKDIPLLIGSNLNEWTTMVPSSAHTNMTEEEKNAFAQAYPNENATGAQNVDTFIRLPMLKIMSHKADQGGASVYAYVFTWEDATRGSSHGAEIPFVFNNASGDANTQKLAKNVSQAWINFAKIGTPSAEDLPKWEAYDRKNGATMILDTESKLMHNHDKRLMELLEPDYIY